MITTKIADFELSTVKSILKQDSSFGGEQGGNESPGAINSGNNLQVLGKFSRQNPKYLVYTLLHLKHLAKSAPVPPNFS